MRLRTKTFTLISLMAFMVFIALYFVASLVILPGFANLEKQEIQEHVIQAGNTINYALSELESKVNDWAFWDDTYYFAQDGNSDYIHNNLMDEVFINFRINLLIVTDPNGSILYSKSFDLLNAVETSTPQSVKEKFTSDSLLWNFSSFDDKTMGVVLLPDQAMLVVSEPILNSQSEGPIAGALAFGVYVDSGEINLYKYSCHD